MSNTLLLEQTEKIESLYRKRTPISEKMIEEAARFVAGGVTRDTSWWKPYPIFVKKGVGCKIIDVDNNEMIDYNNNFSSGLLGHCHPSIVDAIREASGKILSSGAATEEIHQWAQLFCERYSSIDKMRFCCSGTEAVMFACRAARAFTGKDKILKQAGSYHGTTPEAEVGMTTSFKGIPEYVRESVLITDLFDRKMVEQIIEENKNNLAGLLINGIWFLKGDDTIHFLRSITEKHNIPLIIDEVMSYRFALGGAQECFDVEADISAFGKFIGGGGFACGGFGGREEIMSEFDYMKHEDPVHQSGTFAANPITVAAGIAAMKEITPQLINRLNLLAEQFAEGLTNAFHEQGVKGFVFNNGSLLSVGLGNPVLDPRRAKVSAEQQEVSRLLGLSLLNKGNFTPASGSLFCLSSPMTENEINKTVLDFNTALNELRPLMAEMVPQLLLK